MDFSAKDRVANMTEKKVTLDIEVSSSVSLITEETTVERISEAQGWRSYWPKWCPTSPTLLQNAEEKILKYLKRKYYGKYVQIDDKNKLWTIFLKPENESNAKPTPYVLIHGFGAGVGVWVQNLEMLSKDRPVYAFDLLGFGRSSRPHFSHDAQVAEKQFVDSIERWREKMGLEKFILVGHSFGGYLSGAYALEYPERVKHLVSVDPWGYPQKPETWEPSSEIPTWIRVVGTMIQPFNLLAGLRIAGPWGPRLIKRIRPDLHEKFSGLVEDKDCFNNYVYHCNAQTPSGEVGFKTLHSTWGWAKFPMINKIKGLNPTLPMTFIYGSQTWMDQTVGHQVKQIRGRCPVDVHFIRDAGHHVYAEKSQEFNTRLNKLMENVD